MKVYNTRSKELGILLLLGLMPLRTQPLVAQTPDPSQAGYWEPVQNWPLETIHMVVLQTGKVLAIGRMFPTCDYFLENAEGCIVFDPSNGTVSQVAGPPDPPGIQQAHVLFCAGHSALPDGRIMFNGGFLEANVYRTSIFDPLLGPNGTWTTLTEQTDIGRFYPTLTTLGDGRVLVMAGRSVHDPVEPIYTTPQIFNPAAPLGSQFSLLTDARHCRLAGCGSNPCVLDCSTVPNPDNQFLVHFYPFMFQLADGSVFYGGEDEWPLPNVPIKSKRFGVGGLGSWSDIVVADDPITGGSAVMYKPDKIIKA